jgi:glycine/D-amino acid oxidase-like deaminating enzyme
VPDQNAGAERKMGHMGYRLYDRDVDEITYRAATIDDLAIDEEFVRLPGDLAYWNARHADALRAYLLAKLELESVEARVQIASREELFGEMSRPTEAAIHARVVVDALYVAARRALLETEVEKVRLVGICEAVRAKKECLISLGANLRAEMQGDPSLRVAAKTARDV